MNTMLQTILLGLITAVLLSAFIYLENMHLSFKLLNSLLALGGFALLLYIPKRAVLVAGFAIGLLWFYWIGYSFKYQGVGYMTPIITFGFGIVYLLFFLPLALTNKPYLRAVFLFFLSFFEPFDWNWMRLELPFVQSYFSINTYAFVLILAALAIPSLIKHPKLRFAPLLLLVGALNFGYPLQENAPLKIKLVTTHIKQEYKWTKEALLPTVQMIFSQIDQAKTQGYDVIVFPESVIPLYLNKNPLLVSQLQEKSHGIVIVVGTLLYEKNKSYNVTYKFEEGNYSIAKKVVLVPFGEYIPLPHFMQKIINDTFFNGESDFIAAKKPTDFIIKGITFRNAICYEATCDELYKGDVKYLLATSNNAWFTPSIEPTLQRLLMQYYARKYGVTIYHAANYKGSGVIK